MHRVEIRQEIIDRVLARRGRYHLFDRLEPAKTAVVVIDMQSTFCEPGAPAEVPASRGRHVADTVATLAPRSSARTKISVQTKMPLDSIGIPSNSSLR